ncbi:MAG: class I SAM-dependent methyltransferase [candidate division WOR-3 bacterium]|nr:class I SAM-dependent methyltransferase [candidate division WOR-3 bacterium]
MKGNRNLWDSFWAQKKPEAIYPPVTDIVSELSNFADVKDKLILEPGAGTGRDGIRLAKLGARVFLLDYSESSLKLVQNYLKKEEKDKEVNARLIMADALNIPFKDEIFDIVFHQGLLEHFKDPDLLLKENCRVLKKGGLLLIDVPQTYHLYTLIKNILIFLGLWFAGWERQFTIGSLKNLLKRHGLEPVHFYGDWSRPGIMYKIIREILLRLNINLPMYPGYFGKLTQKFYRLQAKLRSKKIFLYTFLSIGVIARKK